MKGNKFFFVIAAFIAVLAATVISTLIALSVGAPEMVFILQIVGIVLNIGQIALYFAHKVKANSGNPSAGIRVMLLVLNLLWIVLTAANFVFASIGAYLRIDLAAVWVCQLLTILLVYKWWDKIEFRVALHNYDCSEDKYKTGTKTYFTFLIIVIVIQLISVVFPVAVMHTRYRNERLQYRNIMYEKSADGTEYYVKGIYWGQSKKVFVPSEFNGLKVTKILEGALDSETVRNKLFTSAKEIDEVIFEDTEDAPSNVREIGDRAIVGNNIRSISLPKSVESIGKEGIVSENLESVELFAKNGNIYFGTSIVTSSLQTLSLSAESDAVIVFEDNFKKDDLEITIINDSEDPRDTDKMQEKYNYIRQTYPEIRENLTVDNLDKKVLVNFESRMDGLFIPSKILDVVSGVAELRTFMLADLMPSTNAYITDKTFYNSDMIFTDPTSGNRYIFRGWENETGSLVQFVPETYSAVFPKDTTLYARWAKVCSVTYQWGSYYVPIETPGLKTDFIVGEDVNNFDLPTYEGYERDGYQDLKWYCYDSADSEHYSLDTNYLKTLSFRDSVTLTPVWDLEFLGVRTQLRLETNGAEEALNSTFKSFEYDDNNTLYATYSLDHALNKTNRYRVNWTFTPNDLASSFGAEETTGSFELKYDPNLAGSCAMENVTNPDFAVFTCGYTEDTGLVTFTLLTKDVVKSGVYAFSVLATSGNDELTEQTSAGAASVTISVMQKDLEKDAAYFERLKNKYNIRFLEQEFVYDGLPKSVEVTWTPGAPLAVSGLTADAPAYSGNGERAVNKQGYTVSTYLSILKNGAVDPNYQKRAISSKYTIVKCPVTIRWRLDGTNDYGDYSTVYNGAEHRMVAEYGDGVPADIKSNAIALEGQVRATDQGTYVAKIQALSDALAEYYEYVFTDEGKETCTWTIAKRPVELVWTNTQATYNKSWKYVSVAVKNICTRSGVRDNCEVTCKNDAFINAGTYTAEAVSLENENYTLTGGINLSTEWTIAKKAVTVSWESTGDYTIYGGVLHTTYSAAPQTIRAVAEVEEGDQISFLYQGGTRTGVAGEKVDFTNAGDYRISIVGISGAAADNYTIDSLPDNKANCNWTIDKQMLTKSWIDNVNAVSSVYDGNYRTFILAVEGFKGNDVANITEDLFRHVSTNAVDFTCEGSFTSGNLSTYVLDVNVIRAATYALDLTMSLDNYELAAAEEVRTYTISPKTLTFGWYVDATHLTPYYDAAFTYSGTNKEVYPSADAADLCQNAATDAKDALTLTLRNVKCINADTYTAAIEGIVNMVGDVESHDYVASAETVTLTWRIAQKALSVTPNDLSSTYDGSVQEASLRISGFEHGEEAQVNQDCFAWSITANGKTSKLLSAVGVESEYLLTVQAVDADLYELVVSGFGASALMNNYLISETTASLEIAPIQVKLLDWTQTNGYSPVYSGEAQSVTASLTVATVKYVADPETGAWVLAEAADDPVVRYATGKGSRRTNVGDYETTVASFSDTNYVLAADADATREWHITPATLTYAWNNLSNTYTGSLITASLTLSGVQTKDCNLQWRTDHINLSVAADPSNPFDIQLTRTFEAVLDENKEVFSFVYLGVASFDITLECADPNYTVESALYEDTENGGKYTWSDTFSISPRQLQFSWVLSDTSYDEIYYDGAAHQGAYVVSPTNAGSDDVGCVYSYSGACKNAGDYRTTLTGLTNPNYTLEGITSAALQKDWTIKKRTLTGFVWKNEGGNIYQDADYVYDGTQHYVFAVASNVAVNDTVTFTYANAINTAASTLYVATITGIAGTAQDNYDLPTSAPTCNWRISTRTLTVAWRKSGAVASPSYVYDGTTVTLTPVVFSGAVSGETPVLVASSEYAAKDARETSYEAVAAFTSADVNQNYDLDEGTKTWTWTITKRTLTVAWKRDASAASASYVYDGTTVTLTPVVLSGAQNGETPVLSASSDYSKKNVRAESYQAAASLTNADVNKNYLLDETSSIFVWSITPAAVTVGWSLSGDVTSVGGKPTVVYDGGQYVATPILSGVYGTDDVGATVTNDKKTNAGSYAAGVSISNGNYEITSGASYAYEIKAKTISVDSTLDAQTYANSQLTFTLRIEGVAEGDLSAIQSGAANKFSLPSGVTLGSIGYDAGESRLTVQFRATNAATYTVGISALCDNYAVTTGSKAVFTVNKKTITSVALQTNENSIEYDGVSHTPTILFDGLALDRNEIIFGEGTTESATNVGEYHIVVTGLANAANYAYAGSENLAWEITKRPVTISFGTTNSYTDCIYGNNNQLTITVQNICAHSAASLEGLISVTDNAGAKTYSGSQAVIDFSAVDHREAGGYTIMVTPGEWTNYELSSEAIHTVNIAKRTISAALDASSLTYNGSQQTKGVNVTGERSSDSGKVTSVTGNTGTNAGSSYSATVTIKSAYQNNYTFAGSVTSVNLGWSIAKKELTVTSSGNVVYDGLAHTYFTVSGVSNADSLCDFTNNVKTNADTYLPEVSLKNSAWVNYKFAGIETQAYSLAWIISPKGITITGDAAGKEETYSGSAKTFVVNSNAGANTITVTGNTATNVGSYSMTVEVANGNYVISSYPSSWTKNGSKISASWTIKRQTINAPVATQDLIYTGEEQTYPFAASAFYTIDNKTGTNAAKYMATATITNANYCFGWTNATPITNTTIEWTIAPKEVTLNVSKILYEYTGETIRLTYNTTPSMVTMSTTNIEKTEIGQYQAHFILGSDYCFAGGASEKTIAWEIEKVKLSVVFDDQRESTEYSGVPQRINVSISSQGGVDYEGKCLISHAVKTNSGNYTATVTLNLSQAEEGKFELTGVTTYPWTIAPKEVELRVSQKTFDYDGNWHSPTFHVYDANGDEETNAMQCISPSGINKQDASSIPYIAIYTLTSPNYYFKQGEGVNSITNSAKTVAEAYWTINAKEVTLNITANSFTYDGTAKNISYTLSETNVPFDLVGNAQTDANTANAPYCAVFTLTSKNYKFVAGTDVDSVSFNESGYHSATVYWEIAPKKLSTTGAILKVRKKGESAWANYTGTIYYGGEDTFEYEVCLFVEGNDVSEQEIILYNEQKTCSVTGFGTYNINCKFTKNYLFNNNSNEMNFTVKTAVLDLDIAALVAKNPSYASAEALKNAISTESGVINRLEFKYYKPSAYPNGNPTSESEVFATPGTYYIVVSKKNESFSSITFKTRATSFVVSQ